jgi:hypothetical protein
MSRSRLLVRLNVQKIKSSSFLSSLASIIFEKNQGLR